MEPFFLKEYRRLFYFTSSAEYCLTKDKNKILFMERWFQNDRDPKPPDMNLIKRLREKYQTLVFLDGAPHAGNHLLEIIPFADRFFHKSLFKDPGLYRRPLYRRRLFSDYSHRKYGITDARPEIESPLFTSGENASRIELSWNIGLGDYPRRHTRQRIGVALARAGLPGAGRKIFKSGRCPPPPDFSSSRRRIKIHARLEPVLSESTAYQRLVFIKKTVNNPLFVTGTVSQGRYYRELRDSRIVLSPFGWGEVCFRDFEAILSGALLFKPDMSHLVTWPDVYRPGETYVPLDWDGEDLEEKADYYLANDEERRRIAGNAFECYRGQLSSLGERFAGIFAGIIN
jgi:hypothetical protein